MTTIGTADLRQEIKETRYEITISTINVRHEGVKVKAIVRDYLNPEFDIIEGSFEYVPDEIGRLFNAFITTSYSQGLFILGTKFEVVLDHVEYIVEFDFYDN